MMHDDDELDPRWPTIEVELRRQPRVDPAAVDRVMAAVRATRTESGAAVIDFAAPRGGTRGSWLTRRTISLSPLQAAAAVLVLALGAGWMGLRAAADRAGGTGDPSVATEMPDAGTRSGGTAIPVSTSGARPVQFVFVSAEARQVSLVGSFNDWNLEATPLELSTNGVWSVEVPLAPGRHVYSFVVDGKLWVPDSTAPRAPADEFGVSNSIVYVGQGS